MIRMVIIGILLGWIAVQAGHIAVLKVQAEKPCLTDMECELKCGGRV